MGAKRLIEANLPIGTISEHARHEQNIKKGHLHSLHVWWATRPLGVCRAVTLAALLPDPTDDRCPEGFQKKAQEALSWMTGRDLSQPSELREELLKFIGYFSAWGQANEPRWVETARSLVRAAYPDGSPLLVDPFAGIGSIPLEALRLGADSFAGELNPVAVLLLKTVLEEIPRYGERLAEAVREWGGWVKNKVEDELQEFYPKDTDGSIPLAYLWARQIHCEGPGCGAELPLVGLVWLSRKEKHRVALRIVGNKEEKKVEFEIFEPKSEEEVQEGIVRRFAATCPICGYTTPYARVREQLKEQRGGTDNARMVAVITIKPDGSRGYRLPTEQDLEAAAKAKEELEHRKQEHKDFMSLVPDEPAPEARGSGASRAFSVRKWGMETWGDLFTPRQSLALSTFAGAVKDAYSEILKQTEDPAFARAVATSIALAVSNLCQYFSSLSFWSFDHMAKVFQINGLPMRPDFAETNPLMPNLVGGFEFSLNSITQVIEREGNQKLKPGVVHLGSATEIPLPDQSVPIVVTDPPYYDAVPYADLSDFCYVWLKRMVGDLYPDLFKGVLTPKAEECILDPGPPRDNELIKDRDFFENKMKESLAECRRVLSPDGIAVVLFAHKGTAGWEAMLKALIDAGWTITSSWPIETERGARMRAKNSAVLASSVFLVCRPRPANAGVGEWRRVLAELRSKIDEWLPWLDKEGIEGADAIFSCLGPALEVYSKYESVETAGGEIINLTDKKDDEGKVVQRGFLSFVWEEIGRKALRTIAERHMESSDTTGFEEDSLLTTMWLWALRSREGAQSYILPYDDARLLVQGLGADEEKLKRPGGILEVRGEKAKLLSVMERRDSLLGKKEVSSISIEGDKFVPGLRPGTTVLDRLHQAMLLFAEDRGSELKRFLVDEGVGRDDRIWKLANALLRLYPTQTKERGWVDGLLARKKSLGL